MTQKPERVKQVVVVGGGTAGWMTAAALSKFLPSQDTSITLIESEEIGTVGVGEATIPTISSFNKMLGITEDDFVKATQATFKLGIEFANWGRQGDAYFHPFGTYGYDLEGLDFHHYWMRLNQMGEETALDDYSLNAKCAYGGKFIRPMAEHGAAVNRLAYAFHFDAGLYAAFLRRFAESKGVMRIEGKVSQVKKNGETGFIEELSLENGKAISGDLFIDCTGFRGLLIGEALGVEYEDWSHWLPVDRAVAVPCEKQEDPIPYTRATAHGAGWQWRIPLQHRTGNGHVYSSRYTDDQSAEDVLMDNLDGSPLAEPRKLRFTTGRRYEMWHKNCVAMGLSGGFLEPLESTSIHLIQFAISQLIAFFPDKTMNAVERDEFNRLMAVNYEYIRDFIILHYVATERHDTPFWDYVRTMPIPDTLEQKMTLLGGRGRFVRHDSELFSVTSWLAVMAGQRRAPAVYNPIADRLSERNIRESLQNMRALFAKTADALPTHQAFIDRFCSAADVYGEPK